jgi:hypothetical protein
MPWSAQLNHSNRGRRAALGIFLVCQTALAQSPAPPPGGAALEAWLKVGHYRSWRAESAPHDSQGPHFGKVRAYLNPALYESMQSAANRHPQGAVAVKELYGTGDKVLGWSVAVKTADGGASGAN